MKFNSNFNFRQLSTKILVNLSKNWLRTATTFKLTKIQTVSNWLTKSGLKINDQKTEICIFHRKEKSTETVSINNIQITTTNQITILGIVFDSNLTWDPQYNTAIKEANHNLFAIKIISKYFTKEERLTYLLAQITNNLKNDYQKKQSITSVLS